jgi:5-formyltetrahydrofolate cyclo-ligase
VSDLPESTQRVGTQKRLLRTRLLADRRARHAPGADGPALDARLLAALEPLLADVACVAGYAALPAEPGGPGLVALLAGAGRRVLLPVLCPDNDLDWAEFTGPAPAGPPLGTGALAVADLVLVPAVAVDRRTGVRLGRGGGSYDRALPRRRPGTPAIALLYPDEVRDGVPADRHDQRVDAVLTPNGLLRPRPV